MINLFCKHKWEVLGTTVQDYLKEHVNSVGSVRVYPVYATTYLLQCTNCGKLVVRKVKGIESNAQRSPSISST